MMKRTFSALLAGCILLVALGSCAAKPRDVDQALRERSIAMGQKLSAMANDRAYRQVMGGGDAFSEKLDEIAAVDLQTPRAVFGIEVQATEMLSLLEETGALPEETKRILIDRLVTALPQQMNGQAGIDILAASSVLSMDHCFVEKGLAKPLLVISLYDGEWASAVSYRPGEDGAVHATATVLYGPALLEVETPGQMREWLTTHSMLQEFSVRKIE